jgi:hypothetical protein
MLVVQHEHYWTILYIYITLYIYIYVYMYIYIYIYIILCINEQMCVSVIINERKHIAVCNMQHSSLTH